MDPNGSGRGALTLRGRTFAWGTRTYVMAIVNATPDSFSGDGLTAPHAAAARASQMVRLGADFVDIGAESTRPGHVRIGADEERERLLPVVREVRANEPGCAISIDTTKAEVFADAHALGGDIVNSVDGLGDALLAAAVAAGAPVVVVHGARVPRDGEGVVDAVLRYLECEAARAVAAGLAPEAIVLDPGLGFGKTPDENLALLGALSRLVALGFPSLVGASRKSTLGKVAGRPPTERAFATAGAVALAAIAGIDIVRVHDVAEMRDVLAVCDAVTRGWRPDAWEGA